MTCALYDRERGLGVIGLTRTFTTETPRHGGKQEWAIHRQDLPDRRLDRTASIFLFYLFLRVSVSPCLRGECFALVATGCDRAHKGSSPRRHRGTEENKNGQFTAKISRAGDSSEESRFSFFIDYSVSPCLRGECFALVAIEFLRCPLLSLMEPRSRKT